MEDTRRATLSIVATPLGNALDLSPRAAAVLAGAGTVLAEDTRRTGTLLKTLGITANRLVSFHEHNEEARLPQVLGWLAAGTDVALVSDAGTPLLADPGYRLVRAAREAGHAVTPVPGPSAVLAALSAAGIAPYPFSFLGFPPRGAADGRELFARFGATGATLVFFERKTRLGQTLAAALDALGDRECVICRELTKTFEEFITGRLSDFAGRDLELLGEVTVVLGPGQAARSSEAAARAVAAEEAAAGGKPREAARRAAARLSGWTVKEVYAMLPVRESD
ncbi:Ribosomal RNA small subunit methyltransferase I [Solidesulfovibrio carbinoliphilus subsp. oakridgensis]|uniref:Ribosomal RNA small subunit methyltransferase I n=1 Tax=Solidesulfovibrio carbinoliphilus subsp. oakridgensis TaxID=694327 RepID=G7QAN4_9BACT|nr:16S rRNA (cytidine(1402)-2'-O)-methyltransferase [Solidesulfovibrio carbinoliphilus]EHJ49265.1 Ribosomal RNA small subunit methyltransferase I [Solidesulfovibrio carbinoliphilus subsp. oakridgensis]